MIIRNRPPRVLIGRITTFTPFVQPPPADGITASTVIPGLPNPALDTIGEIAAAAQNQSALRRFDFPTPVLVWDFPHNLNRRPDVRLFLPNNVRFYAGITHPDLNNAQATFSQPLAGYAEI
jgi:hypothetical protein